jgi:hypothetical protein
MSNTGFKVTDSANNKITLGSEYTFSVNSPTIIGAASIDATHYVVSYVQVTDSQKGKAIIGAISNDNQIGYGSVYTYSSVAATYNHLCMIDSTHFIIVYVTTGAGRAIIGTISNGNEIAYGSNYMFHNGNTIYPFVTLLDSTHVAIIYTDLADSQKGKAIIGTVSNGNELTFGAEYTYNNATTIAFSASLKIDSTHFIISYKDNGDSSKGKSIIGTVANVNELAFGAEYTFENGAVYTTEQKLIDSSHFIVFSCNTTDHMSKGIVGTIANVNEITFGSAYEFQDTGYQGVNYISAIMLDTTHFILTYVLFDQTAGDFVVGRYREGTIASVNQISYKNQIDTYNSYAIFSQVILLDSTHFLISYDATAGSVGTSVIGTISHQWDLDEFLEPIPAGFSQTITNSGYLVNGTDIINTYIRNDCVNLGGTLSALIAAGRTISTTNYKKLGKDVHGADGLEVFTIVPKGYAAGTTTRVVYTPGTYNEIIPNGRKIVNVVVIGGGGKGGNGGGSGTGSAGGGGGGAGGVALAQIEWPGYGTRNLTLVVGAAENDSVLSYVYSSTTYYIKGLKGSNGSNGSGGGGAGGNSGLTSTSFNSAVAVVISHSENVGNNLGAGGNGGSGAPTNGANGTANTTDVHLYSLIGIGTENGNKGFHYIQHLTAGNYSTIGLTGIAGGTGGTADPGSYPTYVVHGGGGGGGGGQSNNTTSAAGHGATTLTAASGVGCGGGGGISGSAGSAGTGGQIVLFY